MLINFITKYVAQFQKMVRLRGNLNKVMIMIFTSSGNYLNCSNYIPVSLSLA
jgi:hypothetical protein